MGNNVPILDNNAPLLGNNIPILENNASLLENNTTILGNNAPILWNNVPVFYEVSVLFLKKINKVLRTVSDNIVLINHLKQNNMGNSKVSINFASSKYTDEALVTKTNNILDRVDGSPTFQSAQQIIQELRVANTNYINALAKVEGGSKEDTAIKNNCRKTVETLLKKLANAVQTISDGDEAIILSSGMDVNKKPGTVGKLAKPENFTVKPGDNKGSALMMCDAIEYADYYEFEHTVLPVTPTSIWLKDTSKKRKLQKEGLESGKEYAFRITGVATDPSRVYSDIITSYVL